MEINFSISISEPWDFEGPDGKNLIKGNILEIKSNSLLIFKSNAPLIIGNIEGDLLHLSPRYAEYSFADLPSKRVPVNGSIIEGGLSNNSAGYELAENLRFVFIGSIYKEASEADE